MNRERFIPEPLRTYRPDLVPESLRSKFSSPAFIPAAPYVARGNVPTFEAAVLRPIKAGNVGIIEWAKRRIVPGAKLAYKAAKQAGLL